MASGIVTAFSSDAERILTGTPCASAEDSEGESGSEETSGSEGASGSKEASGSKDILASHGATAPLAPVHSASSDEADSVDSTSTPPTDVPAPVVDHPNQWCLEGQYQVYQDAKLLNDKGVLSRTLIVKR